MSYVYTLYEMGAVANAVDAITWGMGWTASSVEPDGSLPPAHDAAMERLNRLMEVLTVIYPEALEWHFDSYVEVPK